MRYHQPFLLHKEPGEDAKGSGKSLCTGLGPLQEPEQAFVGDRPQGSFLPPGALRNGSPPFSTLLARKVACVGCTTRLSAAGQQIRAGE